MGVHIWGEKNVEERSVEYIQERRKKLEEEAKMKAGRKTKEDDFE